MRVKFTDIDGNYLIMEANMIDVTLDEERKVWGVLVKNASSKTNWVAAECKDKQDAIRIAESLAERGIC